MDSSINSSNTIDADRAGSSNQSLIKGDGLELEPSSGIGGNNTSVGIDDSGESVVEVEFDICGDGKVTGTETCDTAIIAGEFGSCPTECSSEDPCIHNVIEGSGCFIECQPAEVECLDDDTCCPQHCNAADDNDCSPQCGDGIVQPEYNEICEPAGAVVDGEALSADLICPTQCEDDGDPCTDQILIGNPDNCNSVCTWPTVTTSIYNDGCCPTGANANTDNDCQPICGNGIQEPDEACDGPIDTGCNPQCDLFTTEQYTCIENFTNIADECRTCMCSQCTTQVMNCIASGDATSDELCSTVIYCGLEAGCTGNACYCGGTNPYGTCLFGAGPCVSEIEQAAGTTNTLEIFFLKDNPNTALGRATAFTDCHMAECPDAC